MKCQLIPIFDEALHNCGMKLVVICQFKNDRLGRHKGELRFISLINLEAVVAASSDNFLLIQQNHPVTQQRPKDVLNQIPRRL